MAFERNFNLDSFLLNALTFSNLIIILDHFQMFLPNVIVMYALGGLGAAFYVSKIPERFLPGMQK